VIEWGSEYKSGERSEEVGERDKSGEAMLVLGGVRVLMLLAWGRGETLLIVV